MSALNLLLTIFKNSHANVIFVLPDIIGSFYH
ncbi:hypothetical protein [Undibacterium sp. Xuan67W]